MNKRFISDLHIKDIHLTSINLKKDTESVDNIYIYLFNFK